MPRGSLCKKPKNTQKRLLKAPPSLQTGVTMMPEGKRRKKRLLWSRGSSVAETGQENGPEKVSSETSYNDAILANATGPQMQTHDSVSA